MAERKPLTAGLSVVPPGADPEAVRAFITQEPKRRQTPHETDSDQTSDGTEVEIASAAIEQPRKIRRSKKGPVPVGLIPVTVRLKPELAGALKRASLERQLSGDEVFTQQDLVELALEPWLRGQGFLS